MCKGELLEAGLSAIRPLQTGGSSASGSRGQEDGLSPGGVTVDGPDETTQEEYEEGEEGRVSRGLVAPAKVSREEREEHERTHTPYRAWCRICVRAMGESYATSATGGKCGGSCAENQYGLLFMSVEDEKAQRIH